MDELILAVEQALENGCWHAALALSLTLPDICGKIDNPGEKSKARYIPWFDTYVAPQITKNYGALIDESGTPRALLSGSNCYGLRCAYLHEGSAELSGQVAQEAVKSFRFVVSPGTSLLHFNRDIEKSQLQVDVRQFCKDILSGVTSWLATGPHIPFSNLLEIEIVDFNKGFKV